jgi:hypothetical protein
MTHIPIIQQKITEKIQYTLAQIEVLKLKILGMPENENELLDKMKIQL